MTEAGAALGVSRTTIKKTIESGKILRDSYAIKLKDYKKVYFILCKWIVKAIQGEGPQLSRVLFFGFFSCTVNFTTADKFKFKFIYNIKLMLQ